MNELMQNTTSKWFETQFPPISLEELNGKAAMLSRIDNKYVVDKSSLKNLIPDLSNHFDILEIDGRRAFTYNTRYFDDQDCSAYYEHHQGLRKGFKVRVRRYVESDLCYLEVKVKGQRGMTVKHRMPYPEAESAALTFEAREFAKTIYSGHYGKPFNYDLHRALDVQYRRITLVAHEGGERMTIDTDLKFHFGEKEISLGNDIFIVETK